jgi:NADH-quinone oxidoreductase subunit H
MFFLIYTILKILVLIVCLLISVAYFTLAERKIMGGIQRRRGPNVIGWVGLFQPLADGLKLFVKETIVPTNSNSIIFLVAPMLTFYLSLMGWLVLPFSEVTVLFDGNLGLLYFFAISGLCVYGVILSGWSSNSKYSFLGCLRSVAQMISYEVSMGFIFLVIIVSAGSLNLIDIVLSQKHMWYVFPHFPMFVAFFIVALAETNRHPFDLPEAEAELVSGYNVEYSAMGFALFFLAEYANMLLMSGLTAILFFGGWLNPFNLNFIPGCLSLSLKLSFFVVCFIWARAALPRYRYDQLMLLGWKIFLPFSLGWLIFTITMLILFDFLPNSF